MKKETGIILSFVSMFIGFILNGLAWTVLPGPTFSTLGLLSGLGLMFGGFVYFVFNLLKK